MSLALLPLELLHALCLHAPNPALAALARTNSLLADAANCVLYRHLSLSSHPRSLPLLRLLAENPARARLVRSLSLVVDPSHLLLRNFYSLLARALNNMPELHDLALHLPPAATWILAHPTPHPRLRVFTSTFPLDPHLAAFLASTPALRQLELGSSLPFPPPGPPPPSIPTSPPSSPPPPPSANSNSAPPFPSHPPDPLPPSPPPLSPSSPTSWAPPTSRASSSPAAPSRPSTSTTATCPKTPWNGSPARKLVPGRPLQTVHLHDGDLSEDAVEWLARSTAPLSILGAVTSAPLVPFLSSLAPRLPHLAHLRILAPFHDAPPLSTNAFYDDVAAALDAMPALVDFELSGVHWAPSYRPCDHGPKRVWHSPPCAPDRLDPPPEDAFDFYSDLFLVY
ncbi:hypothetical protein OF83DRAFT_1084088 [Amylostereum chailletii]|nr:hypothetical protein OF83DRAFT_1084088 [Amylostereum chailletii]